MAEFQHHRIVRFGECDPAGVVYYPVFFNWFHEAMEAWFDEALRVPYAEVIKTVGFPAVKTEARFKQPFELGDEVVITLRLSALDRASITLEFDVLGQGGNVCAQGSVCCVSIGVEEGEFQFKAISIPVNLREKMSEFLITETI
jgi:4-hydroxybenzoyl-CoA thioesterase